MPAEPFVVVFAIFPKVTQLDFTGPYEVLHRLPGAKVVVGSGAGGLVRAEGGLTFNTVPLSGIERCDLICTPGGAGQPEAMADAAYLGEVRRLGLGATYVTSVCSGSLILGAAGLLKGKRAASHWAYRALLPLFGAEVSTARVERDGNTFTGGGVTAGIDFGLTVAAAVAGDATAQAIQLMLEYDPQPPFDAGSPERAPAAVRERVEAQLAALMGKRRAALESALAGV